MSEKDYYLVKIPKNQAKISQKSYYDRNREKILERHKQSYENGAKAIYYEANKESIAKQRKEYYEKNKEHIAEKGRIYRAIIKAKLELADRLKEKLLLSQLSEEKNEIIPNS